MYKAENIGTYIQSERASHNTNPIPLQDVIGQFIYGAIYCDKILVVIVK